MQIHEHTESAQNAPGLTSQPYGLDPAMNDTISLLDLIMVISKRWKFIMLTTVLTMAAVVGFSVYTLKMPPDSPWNPLPNVYTPKVEVLLQETESNSLTAKLNGELGVLAGLAGISGGSGTSSADLAQWLLKSNAILDQVITKFDIIGKNGFTKFPQTTAREYLMAKLTSDFDQTTGILTISFEDIDPVFATDVLNTFLSLLEARFKELTMEKVGVRKKFLEDRLAGAEADLKEAQDNIIAFQKKYGIIDIATQAQNLLQQEADIRSKVISKELEIQNQLQYLRESDPQIVRLRNELKVYKRLLNELQGGFDEFSAETIPQNQIPEVSAKYLNLERDLTIQETIYSMLRQQYETTKIDEADNSRKFQIVERAEVPELKSGPSRGKLCIIVTISIFMLAVMISFVMEYFSRVKEDPEESAKLEYIRNTFRRKKHG